MKPDDIEQFLAEKFKLESARLKSWGTKTNDKAAISFAMAVSEYVRSLMAEARYREAQRIQNKYKKKMKSRNLAMGLSLVDKYIRERMRVTQVMAKAIRNFAEKKEKARAWQPKEHHDKHHKHERSKRHHRHKHKHHHRSSKHHD